MTSPLTKLTVLVGGLLFLSPAHASQPPCSEAPYRQFDFWVGTWQVHTQDGTYAGKNTITKAEGGCLLVERWEGAGGNTGQSYNFYDPGLKVWRQIWVSRGGVIDYSGHWNNGAIELEGEIRYQNGTQAPFRGAWRLQDDGSVLQELKSYDKASESWQEWFTGVYTKASDSPTSSTPPANE